MALVTKYCSPENLASMRDGGFYFSTLETYRQMEKKADPAGWIDYEEGTAQQIVTRPILGEDISISPGVNLKGAVSYGGGEANLAVETRSDTNVFCTTRGSYDATHHAVVRKGANNYNANPTWTCYLELEAQKLNLAFHASMTECYSPAHFDTYGFSVRYENRVAEWIKRELRWSNHSLQLLERQAAFRKPPSFLPEREFRFAAVVTDGSRIRPEPVKTIKQSNRVRILFIEAIVSHGIASD